MEFTSATAIIREVKKGTIFPIYVLQGEEPFFIDQITQFLEQNILTDAEKAFNQSILYGRDVDFKQVLDHARQFPMMASRRLVILKEAHAMRELKSLESYFASPAPQTVFVVAHKKKIDGRIKWVKEAKKSPQVAFFNAQTVPEYKLNDWIREYISSLGLQIEPSGLELLSQYLGTDLKKIANEIEKLTLNLANSRIQTSDVEKYVGASRDFDVFALLKSLSQRNTARVQKITMNLESNIKSQPLQRIIPAMASYFEKVFVVAQNFKNDDRSLGSMIGTYPSFVKEYREMAKIYGIGGLQKAYEKIVDADAMSKGFERRNQEGILKELVGHLLMLQSSR